VHPLVAWSRCLIGVRTLGVVELLRWDYERNGSTSVGLWACGLAEFVCHRGHAPRRYPCHPSLPHPQSATRVVSKTLKHHVFSQPARASGAQTARAAATKRVAQSEWHEWMNWSMSGSCRQKYLFFFSPRDAMGSPCQPTCISCRDRVRVANEPLP
jgi:hypothetical protein